MKDILTETFTVCRNDAVFEGWPDLVRLRSSRMLLVYNECNGHGDRDHSRITLRISDDLGGSWSEKKYIGPETHHGDNWNSIRINQISDGRILLVCDRVIGTETSAETELYLWESRDDGETWSDGKRAGIHGYCSDRIRELSDGTLILCISVFNENAGKTEVWAYRSADRGTSWLDSVKVAADPGYTFIEPALLECRDGTIAVFLRENSKKGYNGFMSLSFDGGRTFEKEQEIPLTGMHRPFAGFLSDGRILLSYREHLSSSLPYPDLKAAVFPEESLLCGMRDRQVFRISHDSSEHPDQGYSAWVQLDDGTVYLVNYIMNRAPKAYIQGCRIRGL